MSINYETQYIYMYIMYMKGIRIINMVYLTVTYNHYL